MPKARPADRRQLERVERRVLAFGVEDRLPDLRRQRAVLLDLGRGDETASAELVEARHLAVEGALGGAGLGRALGGRLAEEDDRANQLVAARPRRPRQEFNLAPILGRRNLRS